MTGTAPMYPDLKIRPTTRERSCRARVIEMDVGKKQRPWAPVTELGQ
jgi:hypothetical protein